MASIEKIYAIWGGNAEALATDLGEQGVTVRQWRNRGSIPPDKWALIIAKASSKGVSLSVSDFGPNKDVLAIARAIDAERDAA